MSNPKRRSYMRFEPPITSIIYISSWYSHKLSKWANKFMRGKHISVEISAITLALGWNRMICSCPEPDSQNNIHSMHGIIIFHAICPNAAELNLLLLQIILVASQRVIVYIWSRKASQTVSITPKMWYEAIDAMRRMQFVQRNFSCACKSKKIYAYRSSSGNRNITATETVFK